MPILFFSEKTDFKITNKVQLVSWIKSTIRKEGGHLGNISFIYCNDDYLLEINKKFLKHHYYTDVITFSYETKTQAKRKETQTKVSGDIFISIDRVLENAKDLKIGFEDELHRVMVHGVLHLLGYKDKTKIAKKLMTKKEDYHLLKLNT